MKKLLVITILLFSQIILSQDNNSLPEKEVTVFLGPSYTNLKSNNLLSDKYASTNGGIWFNMGFNYCKYANKNLGFILGIEYAKYKNVTSYKGSFMSENTSLDPFGEAYYKVSEANYTDTRAIHSIDVPIGLKLSFPLSNQSRFFIDFGLKGNFIVSAKMTQNGTLDKKGAYPHPTYDNVYLYVEDDPYYGYTNAKYSPDNEIEIPVNRVNASYFLGLGIQAKINDDLFISISPSYSNGINDVYKKDGVSDYVNIFGEKSAHQKFTLTQFALRVGIGFSI